MNKNLSFSTDFLSFIQAVSQNIEDIYSRCPNLKDQIEHFQSQLDRCTQEQFDIITKNPYFVSASIPHLGNNSSLLTRLSLHYIDNKQKDFTNFTLSHSKNLSESAFRSILSELHRIDFVLELFNLDHDFIQRLFLVAYQSKRYDVVKRLETIVINPEIINSTDALNDGAYLLALLSLRDKDISVKPQVSKCLSLDNKQAAPDFERFLNKLYQGKLRQIEPIQVEDPFDEYYEQLQLLGKEITKCYQQVALDKIFDIKSLTEPSYVIPVKLDDKKLLKSLLEQFCFALSDNSVANEKKLYALKQLSVLNTDVCLPGKLSRIITLINSLNSMNKQLNYALAKIRLDLLNEYLEQLMKRRELDDSNYPHIQRNALNWLAKNGWTILEQDKASINDPFAEQITLTKRDKEDLLHFFNTKNSIHFYVERFIYLLLDHFNTLNLQPLIYDELPNYRFNLEEKTQYLKLLETFDLVPIDEKVLFETVENQLSALEFKINIPELFSCIAYYLYDQNIFIGLPPRNIIELCQTTENAIISFKVEGQVFVIQNFTEIIRKCLNTSEIKFEPILSQYILQLKKCIFTENDDDLTSYFLSLEQDVKLRILQLLLIRDNELWSQLISWLITADDKELLRILILNDVKPFVDQIKTNYFIYADLCSLFLEEPPILNVLLNIIPFKNIGLSMSEPHVRKLVPNIVGSLTDYYLKEDHFKQLEDWIKTKNKNNYYLCWFVASYCPELLIKLIGNAIESGNFIDLQQMISYVWNKDVSYLSLQVKKNEQFKAFYIECLHHAINTKNSDLFTTLTDFPPFEDEEDRYFYGAPLMHAGLTSTAFSSLTRACITSKQPEMLKTLMTSINWVSWIEDGKKVMHGGQLNQVILKFHEFFREDFISFLKAAIIDGDHPIVDVLIQSKNISRDIQFPNHFMIQESPLYIIAQNNPQAFTDLFNLCISKNDADLLMHFLLIEEELFRKEEMKTLYIDNLNNFFKAPNTSTCVNVLLQKLFNNKEYKDIFHLILLNTRYFKNPLINEMIFNLFRPGVHQLPVDFFKKLVNNPSLVQLWNSNPQRFISVINTYWKIKNYEPFTLLLCSKLFPAIPDNNKSQFIEIISGAISDRKADDLALFNSVDLSNRNSVLLDLYNNKQEEYIKLIKLSVKHKEYSALKHLLFADKRILENKNFIIDGMILLTHAVAIKKTEWISLFINKQNSATHPYPFLTLAYETQTKEYLKLIDQCFQLGDSSTLKILLSFNEEVITSTDVIKMIMDLLNEAINNKNSKMIKLLTQKNINSSVPSPYITTLKKAALSDSLKLIEHSIEEEEYALVKQALTIDDDSIRSKIRNFIFDILEKRGHQKNAQLIYQLAEIENDLSAIFDEMYIQRSASYIALIDRALEKGDHRVVKHLISVNSAILEQEPLASRWKQFINYVINLDQKSLVSLLSSDQESFYSPNFLLSHLFSNHLTDYVELVKRSIASKDYTTLKTLISITEPIFDVEQLINTECLQLLQLAIENGDHSLIKLLITDHNPQTPSAFILSLYNNNLDQYCSIILQCFAKNNYEIIHQLTIRNNEVLKNKVIQNLLLGLFNKATESEQIQLIKLFITVDKGSILYSSLFNSLPLMKQYVKLFDSCVNEGEYSILAELMFNDVVLFQNSTFRKACSTLILNQLQSENFEFLSALALTNNQFTSEIKVLLNGIYRSERTNFHSLVKESINQKQWFLLKQLINLNDEVLDDDLIRNACLDLVSKKDDNKECDFLFEKNESSILNRVFLRDQEEYSHLICQSIEQEHFKFLELLLSNIYGSDEHRFAYCDKLYDFLRQIMKQCNPEIAKLIAKYTPSQTHEELINQLKSFKFHYEFVPCMKQREGVEDLPYAPLNGSLPIISMRDIGEVKDLPSTPLYASFKRAFGANKVAVKHLILKKDIKADATNNENAKLIAYFSTPTNTLELSQQVNEVITNLKLNSSYGLTIQGVLFEDNHLKAVIYANLSIELSMKETISRHNIDLMVSLPYFYRQLLLLGNVAKKSGLTLSSVGFVNHTFIYRNSASNQLFIAYVNPVTVTEFNAKELWTDDFIFEIGTLILRHICQLYQLDFLEIKRSLLGKTTRSNINGYEIIRSLNFKEEWSGFFDVLVGSIIPDPYERYSFDEALRKLGVFLQKLTPIIKPRIDIYSFFKPKTDLTEHVPSNDEIKKTSFSWFN